MSKKRYLEAEMLKEFLRMGMKVGHIHTLRDVENYIHTQPELTVSWKQIVHILP